MGRNITCRTHLCHSPRFPALPLPRAYTPSTLPAHSPFTSVPDPHPLPPCHYSPLPWVVPACGPTMQCHCLGLGGLLTPPPTTPPAPDSAARQTKKARQPPFQPSTSQFPSGAVFMPFLCPHACPAAARHSPPPTTVLRVGAHAACRSFDAPRHHTEQRDSTLPTPPVPTCPSPPPACPLTTPNI